MKTYYRILNYIKPYWKHLLLSVISTILYSLLHGATIYLTIPLLDTLFKESDRSVHEVTEKEEVSEIAPDWITDFIENLSKVFEDYVFTGGYEEILFRICSLILLAFLFKNVFGYLQAYFLAYVEQGVIRDLRNSAFTYLHQLPIRYFVSEKSGNLISRITNDVNVVQQSVSAVFLNLIREPLTILVFLGIALSISPKLTLFSFVVLPFSIGIIVWVGNILRKQSTILQEKMADITSILQETILGVKIVKAFGMENYENQRFKGETQKYFKLVLKIARIRNSASPLTEFLSVIVGAVIIYYGGKLVLQDIRILRISFCIGTLMVKGRKKLLVQTILIFKELSCATQTIKQLLR